MTSIINLRYHAINLAGGGLSHSTNSFNSVLCTCMSIIFFFFRSRMVQGSTGRLEVWMIEKALLENYNVRR